VWIATVKGILGFDMDYNFWFGIDIFNNKRIAMIGMSKEGTIWSGTTNGGTIASLNRINGKSLVLMYTDLNAHVLRGCSGVTCMAADANKTVYFGTENRGLIQVRFPKL
jgi:ligand-binding sensor domain-containing protein